MVLTESRLMPVFFERRRVDPLALVPGLAVEALVDARERVQLAVGRGQVLAEGRVLFERGLQLRRPGVHQFVERHEQALRAVGIELRAGEAAHPAGAEHEDVGQVAGRHHRVDLRGAVLAGGHDLVLHLDAGDVFEVLGVEVGGVGVLSLEAAGDDAILGGAIGELRELTGLGAHVALGVEHALELGAELDLQLRAAGNVLAGSRGARGAAARAGGRGVAATGAEPGDACDGNAAEEEGASADFGLLQGIVEHDGFLSMVVAEAPENQKRPLLVVRLANQLTMRSRMRPTMLLKRPMAVA